jgi:hypothetical protein
MEAAEYVREHVGRDRGTGGDAERSSFEAPELTELAFGDPFDAEEFSGAAVEGFPGVGEVDASAAALDERHVELALQFIE